MGGRRLIPNSSKEMQWQKLTSILDKKTPERRPVSIELKLLHRIFSIGAREHLIHEEQKELVRLMHFVDRPDLDFAGFVELRKKVGKHTCALFTLPLTDFQHLLGNVDIQFRPSIRGHLRSYGKRKIHGHWETVYASHTFSIGADSESPLAPTYYGLSYQLDKSYESLCSKFDKLYVESSTFEQRLLSESFLQLVGTRILHPFWDGNGRTFIAHLTLMLEREGIRIREFEKIMDIAKALSPIQNKFLSKFIEHAGLKPISGENHFKIHTDMDFRNEYMKKLGAAINAAIAEGLSPVTLFYADFLNARQVILDHI